MCTYCMPGRRYSYCCTIVTVNKHDNTTMAECCSKLKKSDTLRSGKTQRSKARAISLPTNTHQGLLTLRATSHLRVCCCCVPPREGDDVLAVTWIFFFFKIEYAKKHGHIPLFLKPKMRRIYIVVRVEHQSLQSAVLKSTTQSRGPVFC